MSTYRTSTITLDPDVVSLSRLLGAEYDALLAGLCSADAHALAEDAHRTGTRIGWDAVQAALPRWESLPTTSTDALRSARDGVGSIDAALGVVADDLAALERTAVMALAADVLIDLGYGFETAAGPTTSALEARRGHEVLLVVVENGGSITTDHAGLADDACQDRQADFVAAMARRGVRLDERAEVRHHDPRGGTPILTAARAGQANLAAGAVATSRRKAAAPAQRRAVDAERSR